MRRATVDDLQAIIEEARALCDICPTCGAYWECERFTDIGPITDWPIGKLARDAYPAALCQNCTGTHRGFECAPVRGPWP